MSIFDQALKLGMSAAGGGNPLASLLGASGMLGGGNNNGMGGNPFDAAVSLTSNSNKSRVNAEAAMSADAAQANTESTAIGMDMDNKFSANNMARSLNNACNKAAIDGINKACQNA